MTPEAVLLALIAALLVALVIVVLIVVFRMGNSDGTISWSVKTTIPDDPWSFKFTSKERDEAMRAFAHRRLRSEADIDEARRADTLPPTE